MPDQTEAQTLEAPAEQAEQPQADGTGKPGYISLFELSQQTDSTADGGEQPGAGDAGETGAPEGDVEAAEQGGDDVKDSKPVGDGLVEVEIYGIKERVSAERAKLIEDARALDARKQALVQEELEFKRKQVGKLQHEAKAKAKPDATAQEAAAAIDPDGIVKAISGPLAQYDRDGDAKAFVAAVSEVQKGEIAPVLAELDLYRRATRELLDKVENLERLAGETASHVAPEQERSNVRAYAKGDAGYSSLPDAAIDSAYRAAKPEWDAEIKELELDPQGPSAQKLMRKVLHRHLEAAKAAAIPAATNGSKNTGPAKKPAAVPGLKGKPLPSTSPVELPPFGAGLHALVGR